VFAQRPISGNSEPAAAFPLMYHWRMRSTMLIVALLVGSGSGQVVQTGPVDPDWCYKIENVNPNLTVQKAVRIFGTVEDQSGAPFRNSRMELRKYVSPRKQVSVRVLSTDAHGRFDFGPVEPGKFRLLASPNRQFQQPSALQCHDGPSCELDIKLVVNSTDQLDASCPIR
jgi:hypothetical protein